MFQAIHFQGRDARSDLKAHRQVHSAPTIRQSPKRETIQDPIQLNYARKRLTGSMIITFCEV
jgi:hypothetical protein